MCVSVGVKKRKVTHLPSASSLLYSFFNTLHAFSLLHLFSRSVLLFYSIFEFLPRYKLKWWCNELFSSITYIFTTMSWPWFELRRRAENIEWACECLLFGVRYKTHLISSELQRKYFIAVENKMDPWSCETDLPFVCVLYYSNSYIINIHSQKALRQTSTNAGNNL